MFKHTVQLGTHDVSFFFEIFWLFQNFYFWDFLTGLISFANKEKLLICERNPTENSCKAGGVTLANMYVFLYSRCLLVVNFFLAGIPRLITKKTALKTTVKLFQIIGLSTTACRELSEASCRFEEVDYLFIPKFSTSTGQKKNNEKDSTRTFIIILFV